MEQRVFLDRYRSVRLLGEGGTSRVYLARARNTGEQVVVKVLQEHLATDPRFRDCFQREMMLLRRFQHPNAVSLLDASVNDPEGPCIVMEYIPGENLDAYLAKNGRLGPQRVGRLLVQICRVLQAAHNQGIIHRDLKPGNLMIVSPETPAERVKVMDFGLAQLATALYIPLEHLARTGHEYAAGTPEYMSPEEIRRETVDYRADIYSLGIILFQFLTGRVPFQGTVPELLKAHTDKRPPTFAECSLWLPPGLERVVQSCLGKYPVERPQSASELAERYERALGQKLRREAIEEPSSPSSLHDEPVGALVPIAVDSNTVVRHLEAFMPEKIAVVKLRGFVDEIGGEAVESVPGMIRVRMAERRGSSSESSGKIFDWLKRGRKPEAPRIVHPTEMELHMKKKGSSPQSLLELTVLLRPEGGRQQAADPQWQAYCERIFLSLRAYLMGRG